LDEVGIESKVIGKIEYQWQHLIIVCCKMLLTLGCSILNWSVFAWRYYQRKPMWQCNVLLGLVWYAIKWIQLKVVLMKIIVTIFKLAYFRHYAFLFWVFICASV